MLIAVSFCLFGFILGCWADGFEKLQVVPLMIVTPLTFLGGTFYSIDMLPRAVADGDFVQPDRLSGERLPLDLLRRGGRQYLDLGRPDVAFLIACIAVVALIFRTGWRLRS